MCSELPKADLSEILVSFKPPISAVAAFLLFLTVSNFITFSIGPIVYLEAVLRLKIFLILPSDKILILGSDILMSISILLAIFFQAGAHQSNLRLIGIKEYRVLEKTISNSFFLLFFTISSVLFLIFFLHCLDFADDPTLIGLNSLDGILKYHYDNLSFFPFSFSKSLGLFFLYFCLYIVFYDTVLTRFLSIPFQYYIWSRLFSIKT